MRLTTRDVSRIRELRYEDGLTLAATAEAVGCSEFPVWRYAPGRPGKIANTALREAFLASGKTAADVARRLGWDSGNGADTSRVRRKLGLLPERSGSNGRKSFTRHIDAETAALMAEAIGVMPWEVGA